MLHSVDVFNTRDNSRLLKLSWLGALLALVFFIPTFVGAADARSHFPPQVKFKALPFPDLEKLGYINDIAQDKDGYIWFGAIKGLARYDGYQIKTFLHDPKNPVGISHNWVKSLLVSSKGELWATTHEGLCRYVPNAENFDCVTFEAEDGGAYRLGAFYSLMEDSKGRFWTSTSKGLQILDPATGRLIPGPKALTNTMPPLSGSEDNTVFAAAEDASGNLWFGLDASGLVRFHPDSLDITHFRANPDVADALPSNKIRDLFLDSKNQLWVATMGGGLSLFEEDTLSFKHITHSSDEKADTVWSVTEDNNGLLWIGDGNGVHLYDSASGESDRYSYAEGKTGGPANFVVRKIFIDRTDGIWTGYFPSGIDVIDLQASQFRNFSHNPNDPQTLADGGVLATLADANGDIWVGCGFGLSLLHRDTGLFERFVNIKDDPNSISGSTVLDIAADNDGSLWVGAWDRGLNRLLPDRSKFIRYQHDPNEPRSLLGREPWSVMIDKRGDLWVGTERGVNRFNPNTNDFDHILPFDRNGVKLNGLYTRHIIEDSKGRIWVGSFNGLYQIDPATDSYVRHYFNDASKPSSLASNQILALFEDSSGFIWIGTNGNGLDRFDPGSEYFKHYGAEQGLTDLAITGMIEDTDGNLWVSTYQGLARLDHQRGQFEMFDERDGPLGNLYNRRSPSLLPSGELVFGSTRGLTIFDPRKLRSNQHPPHVVFTQLSIFNKLVSPSEDGPLTASINHTDVLSLNHTDSVFSLEYAGLDYRSPEENRYAYRLLGFESEWNYVGNRRSATYTNLDPGDYTFQVKAANDSGVWNENIRELKIIVRPPFWATPLAYFFYVLTACLLVLRMAQVQRNKLYYERDKLAQERAIVKQLKDIHQMKDELNRELDRKVAERTEALHQEQQRLLAAQQELQTLNHKLEDVSLTDPLTGLRNRRFLYQSIEDDVAMINRQYLQQPTAWQSSAASQNMNDLTFIVVDVDHFKQVNDRYSHKIGDVVLVQFSEILKRVLRESDYVIRWGGEEFVIVVRHLPRSKVTTVVERLLKSVENYNFDCGGDLRVHQTCSIGVAAYPFVPSKPHGVSWEQVINIADHALYSAKASGRNCWVWLHANETLLKPEIVCHALETAELATLVRSGELEPQSSIAVNKLVWPN
ncbi:ligand-binding sensor domain-containing diguanylate cyclase [Teredinibacter waterburyi]|uniref:ligand-binding sensor domain-containing diguanylate cyclase n=1 Tax=Teredinibacter waterburyi TaxID=1500538 RepID=UPI00165FC5F8|nr:two-component regulator propeller domain-containing protein [Teredinibacter waterburyi]